MSFTPSATQVAGEGPVPFLFGGRLCLDFVNTVNSRSRPASKDYLPDWEALAGWCRQTALFEPAILERLEARARKLPGKAVQAHAAAMALREALYRILRGVLDGEAEPEADMRLLNIWLREARMRQVLAKTPAGFVWEWDEAQMDVRTPACAVALSAGDVLLREDLRRLKECPGPDGCGWLFYDETRNASRRWCSMEHCGGAAKARRYAARHGS